MRQVATSSLITRMACSENDIRAAQRLRYEVFYSEFSARPDAQTRKTGLDKDRFDPLCHHVLVIETNPLDIQSGVQLDDGILVGTYRLLGQQTATANFGFYSQAEFNIDKLLVRHPDLNFLELGRSCVARQYRNRPVIEKLWQVIWDHVRQNSIDVLFGCASLPGTNIQNLRSALAFLYSCYKGAEEWQVSAIRSTDYIDLEYLVQQLNQSEQFTGQNLRLLPPLVRGYLKVGAVVSKHAVIDQQFDTTDVLMILPVCNIHKRYFARFGYPDQI